MAFVGIYFIRITKILGCLSSYNLSNAEWFLFFLQYIGKTSEPFFVTVNPDHTPKNTLLKWSTGHAIPSVAASKASLELGQIQGKRGIWFCGEILMKLVNILDQNFGEK